MSIVLKAVAGKWSSKLIWKVDINMYKLVVPTHDLIDVKFVLFDLLGLAANWIDWFCDILRLAFPLSLDFSIKQNFEIFQRWSPYRICRQLNYRFLPGGVDLVLDSFLFTISWTRDYVSTASCLLFISHWISLIIVSLLPLGTSIYFVLFFVPSMVYPCLSSHG